ncbi:hypothetical protein G5I_13601 [Acromyrmex echinatior]|uniref:Uncharacterized protein n=1 Tax=Acromyrmex echinatior TaxID=103372 RepID=F4X5G9_ACREC|nr:hypothetical protein G5I_13601 [Acromyrmex echinatior]
MDSCAQLNLFNSVFDSGKFASIWVGLMTLFALQLVEHVTSTNGTAYDVLNPILSHLAEEKRGDDPPTEFAYVVSRRRGVEEGWETTVSNDRNNVSPATRRMVKSKVQRSPSFYLRRRWSSDFYSQTACREARHSFCRFQCLRITGVADDLKLLEQGDLANSIHNTSTSFCWSPQGVYHVRFAFATDSTACGQSCSETSRREKQETLATMYMYAVDKRLSTSHNPT